MSALWMAVWDRGITTKIFFLFAHAVEFLFFFNLFVFYIMCVWRLKRTNVDAEFIQKAKRNWKISKSIKL